MRNLLSTPGHLAIKEQLNISIFKVSAGRQDLKPLNLRMATVPKLPLNPLAKTSEEELATLASSLWEWSLCALCTNGHHCQREEQCPSNRSKRLQSFFEFYKTLATSYEGNDAGYPALRTHGDVLIILDQLKTKPASPRSKLREALLEDI